MSDTLTFKFDRRADEYVDGAFAASYRMQGAGSSGWLPGNGAILGWILVFLVTLGAMQLAQMGGFGPNTVLVFLVGAAVGFFGLFLAVMSSQRRLSRAMKSVVKEGSDVVTRLNAEGVSSIDEVAEIGTPWDQAHMIWVHDNILHIMTDMFVHIIPARALPAGQSIDQLHQMVLRMRDDQMRTAQP